MFGGRVEREDRIRELAKLNPIDRAAEGLAAFRRGERLVPVSQAEKPRKGLRRHFRRELSGGNLGWDVSEEHWVMGTEEEQKQCNCVCLQRMSTRPDIVFYLRQLHGKSVGAGDDDFVDTELCLERIAGELLHEGNAPNAAYVLASLTHGFAPQHPDKMAQISLRAFKNNPNALGVLKPGVEKALEKKRRK